MKRAFVVAGFTGFFFAAVVSTVGAAPSAEIQRRMEQLELGQERTIAGVKLEAVRLLPALYADRGYEPLWTRPDAIIQIQNLIDYAVSEGLDASDYPVGALVGLNGSDPVAADLLSSEILIRVAYHLRFGKVNPQALDPHWNFDRHLSANANPPKTLQQAAAAPSVADFVASFFPRGELYADVKVALAEYRKLEAAGGWPSIGTDPVLREGASDAVVPQIRARLAVTDGAPPAAGDPNLYDASLAKAVVAFQSRHGLDADAVVGAGTYAALNVPIAQRIDQLRLTLERGRWIMEDLSGRFILVNIAAFRAALVKDREFVWSAKVQVGKPYRATPTFKGELEYIQVNPTWTVPPTILSKDTLPAIKKDPTYLERKNMVVLRHDGTKVDPTTIDWANMTGKFPYMIRQQPGPTNALGRVKFIFPNKHFIFLHDTPSKALFDRSDRAFSSGCIRVENPFELAVLLMNDPAKWSQADFDALMAAAETKNLYPVPKVPVYILYWTATARGGVVYFHHDIYERDGPLLAAMGAETRIDLPGN